MASKTTKRTTISSTTSSTTSTPQAGPSQRPGSPLSPTRVSRLQEKVELQNLNDRLACYIDRVRHLETENAKLTREVETQQEHITREVTTISSMFEGELNDARKMVDETARDKAKLEMEVMRLKEAKNNLAVQLDKKSKALATAEKNLHVNEIRLNELTTRLRQAEADRSKLLDDEKERDRLTQLVNELRKQLEEETLLRVDAENALQTLKEDFAFKEQIHNQQLTEVRTRRQIEISEIDGQLRDQYKEREVSMLQELREDYETKLLMNRDELDALYQGKIRSLENQLQRNSDNSSSATEELHIAHMRNEALGGKVSELEASNASLLSRVQDLEQILSEERRRNKIHIEMLEKELKNLRDEMDAHLQEYQDLMDTNVKLDIEITAYRKLLEGEEQRLKISPAQSPAQPLGRAARSTPVRRTPVRSTPVRGAKRMRLDESSEDSSYSNYQVNTRAKGDVVINAICPDGKFVKLQNKGTKEAAIGGWQLVRQAGDSEATFRFHRSVKIEPGSIITVWSSDAGQTHEPPTNIVMKTQKWVVGEVMTTALMNPQGEEMAYSERKRQTLVSTSTRHRETGGLGSLESGKEEMYHHRGDPQGERCRLM